MTRSRALKSPLLYVPDKVPVSSFHLKCPRSLLILHTRMEPSGAFAETFESLSTHCTTACHDALIVTRHDTTLFVFISISLFLTLIWIPWLETLTAL